MQYVASGMSSEEVIFWPGFCPRLAHVRERPMPKDIILQKMIRERIPLTVENYVYLAYMGSKTFDDWARKSWPNCRRYFVGRRCGQLALHASTTRIHLSAWPATHELALVIKSGACSTCVAWVIENRLFSVVLSPVWLVDCAVAREPQAQT